MLKLSDLMKKATPQQQLFLMPAVQLKAIFLKVNAILAELNNFVEDAFVDYFISLVAPKMWRINVDRYVQELQVALGQDGFSETEIKHKTYYCSHVFEEGEFKVQTTTTRLKGNLEAGRWENIQAQRAIKTIYDDWESCYRLELENLLGFDVKGDIWRDLNYIRQSITHYRAIGISKLEGVKLIKDFIPGKPVLFTPPIMEKIREELENWSEEFKMTFFPHKKMYP